MSAGPPSSESTGAICLIDLDDGDGFSSPSPAASFSNKATAATSNANPMGDLLGDLESLDFSGSSLSTRTNTTAAAPALTQSNTSGNSDLDQLFMSSPPAASGSNDSANSGMYIFDLSAENVYVVTLLNKNGIQIKLDYSSNASGLLTGVVTVINTTPVAFKDLELSFAVPKVSRIHFHFLIIHGRRP